MNRKPENHITILSEATLLGTIFGLFNIAQVLSIYKGTDRNSRKDENGFPADVGI